MSILPDNVMNTVESEFKTRQSKAVAMELLTAWRKMPSWKEKETIGERHGRNVKTVHEISQKLQELELFTDEQGSIPLYRLELEKRGGQPSNVGGLPESGDSTKIMSELPEFSPAGYPLEDESGEYSSATSDEFGALQNKVNRIAVQLEGFGKQIENLIPVIQGLSAKTPETPPPTNNPTPPDPPVPQIPQTETPDPLTSLTREDLVELAINQPNQFLAMVGATGSRSIGQGLRETDVMSSPETIRKMIIEVRTYTMMLFEKAIADGAFEGSMSDFLNDMAEKYFEDRGYALGWHRFEPGRRRLG